jgi:hypothetical protein
MLYLRAVRANGSNAGESPSSTMQLSGYSCIPVGAAPPLLLVRIHPSAWKDNSANFAGDGFSEVVRLFRLWPSDRGTPAVIMSMPGGYGVDRS